MKDVIIKAPHQITLSASEEQSQLEDHDVKVRISTVSLCGSDYQLYEGQYSAPNTYPIAFGHEWSGTVLAVGSKVTKVSVGDKVTGDCSKYCDDCSLCHKDKNLCQNIEKFGLTTNGYSRQIVYTDDLHIYKVPDHLSLQTAALTEPFAVALHAIHTCRIDPTAKILIIGTGSIGIAAYLLFKYKFNCANITVYDICKERMAFVKEQIDDNLKVLDENELKDCSGYHEMYSKDGYDLIFEATGSIQALASALNLANPLGDIITIGMYKEASIELKKLTLKRLSLHGSIGGTGEFEEILQFFTEHEDTVKKMITTTYVYQDSAKAFEESRLDKRNIKCQISFE